MYTIRLNSNELKNNLDVVLENLTDTDTCQIVKSGSGCFVMLTQESYLRLLEKIPYPEENVLVENPTKEELLERIESTTSLMYNTRSNKEIEDFLEERFNR